MIRLPERIYVATAPINLRLSFDRLGGLVRDLLKHEPREEAAFVFHNRARTHVKILWHDGRGYCLLYKRLDRGSYQIPLAIPPGAAEVSVSRRELKNLFDGLDTALIRRAKGLARAHRHSSSTAASAAVALAAK